MGNVEKFTKSQRDGIDNMKARARHAAIIDRMKAEKIPGNRLPQRGDVINGILKGAVKGCAGYLKKFSHRCTAGGREGKERHAVAARKTFLTRQTLHSFTIISGWPGKSTDHIVTRW